MKLIILPLILTLAALGQNVPQTIMSIDIDNGVFYTRDSADNTKLATITLPTPEIPSKNFAIYEGIGDIVAVNGKPMKGTWYSRAVQLVLNPTPQAGQGIADVNITGTLEWIMDIRMPDGRAVGMITGYGWNTPPGQRPAGAPPRLASLNMAITGGTGAYVGIRGQMGINNAERNAEAGIPPAYRGNASVTEDPRNRTINGVGQTRRHILHIFPMAAPEILCVMRSDFSLVTPHHPLAAGERVILFVSNLGPVSPSVDVDQPFPSSPLASVNSPVEVLVNGKETTALTAQGWPGYTDKYRVDFVVPDGLPAGTATLQIRAAFLNGVKAEIPIAAANRSRRAMIQQTR